MKVNPDPYRDMQAQPPEGVCARCGNELYSYDQDGICAGCAAEAERYDADTVSAVMAAMDMELRKYLSDDLRDSVWNALVRRFPAA